MQETYEDGNSERFIRHFCARGEILMSVKFDRKSVRKQRQQKRIFSSLLIIIKIYKEFKSSETKICNFN